MHVVMQVTLGELVHEVQTEQAQLPSSSGTGYNTVRRGVGQIPGQFLRPGAPKMMLRPEEEEELALVRLPVHSTTCGWHSEQEVPLIQIA